MMNELQKAMKDKSPDPETTWTEGMECVALASHSRCWSRAIVGEKVGDRLKVNCQVILHHVQYYVVFFV
jgi:Tudor domain